MPRAGIFHSTPAVRHMAARSMAPNTVIAWRIAADKKNKANTHRKYLQCNIASAIAPMAVIDIVAPLAVVIVPKADSAPMAVTKIVRQAVVIVKKDTPNAIMQTLANAKYGTGIAEESCKG